MNLQDVRDLYESYPRTGGIIGPMFDPLANQFVLALNGTPLSERYQFVSMAELRLWAFPKGYAVSSKVKLVFDQYRRGW